MTIRGWRAGIGMAGMIALAQAAVAQNAATRGTPTREEIARATPLRVTEAPSRLTVTGGIERAPCPLADARYADTTLTLTGARFQHLAGLSADDLRPAYADYLGKTVPLSALCEVRDAAAAILRRAGYIAAVQVPPQPAGDGIVRFDVVMARLVRVDVRGDRGQSTRPLAAYLAKLTARPLFNEREAERYLLLARDLPGYDVTLTLRPAALPGEVVGEVVATRTPIVLAANVQNYGSDEVGRFGELISAQLNDVIGQGDRLSLGLFASARPREQTAYQAGYELRLGGEGAALSARLAYARTRPSVGGGDPYRSGTRVGSLEASYPVRRSQAGNLRAAVGLDVVDQDLRYTGVLLTRDRLRAAYLRIDLDATLPRWRLGTTIEARRGLGLLGASADCGAAPAYPRCATLPTLSRIQADPRAALLRVSGYAEFRPRAAIGLILSPRAQSAFAPLLSYEQYSGGGYTIGRGYDPGAAIGDSGAGFSLEAQYGTLVPRSANAVAWQPYLFLDAAWAWNRRTPPPEDDPLRLRSMGGGVRVAWGDHARIDLAAAHPRLRAPGQTTRGDTRVLLSLTTRLAPSTGR